MFTVKAFLLTLCSLCVWTADAAQRKLRHRLRSLHATGMEKRAFKCFVGEDDEGAGDLADCVDDEDRCFMRYEVDPATRKPMTGRVKRYCTHSDRCQELENEDFFAFQEQNGAEIVAKCCTAEACNGGFPAQIPGGLYWIQPTDSDTYVTAPKGGGALAEADFANDGTQKFQISKIEGGEFNGKYSIAPFGLADPEMEWSVLEVEAGKLEIIGNSPAGLAPLVGQGPGVTFKLERTTRWEVGWRDKRCPSSREVVTAKDPQSCQDACEQDAGCKDIIEWSEDHQQCFLVTQDCPMKDLEDSAGFVLYKSACAGVVCAAKSQCHMAGTCDMVSGQCSEPLLEEGSACDDGDFTTANDVCKAGECGGVNLCEGKTCSAETQCHDVGVCDFATGHCIEKLKPGGSGCNDGVDETVNDVCNLGACSGINLCASVTCEPKDSCHEAGSCDIQTGTCSEIVKDDESSCDDGDEDTIDDKCFSGVCRGKGKCEDVTCARMGACYLAGSCDPKTGRCDDPFADAGSACDDGSDITVGDACDGNGQCLGNDHCSGKVCSADGLDQCQNPGACDPANGNCLVVLKQDGTACEDGDDNTVNDVCINGECQGTNLCEQVTCTALDDCHEPGTCDFQTGQCDDIRKEDGSACNDNDDFTEDDQCHAGVCQGVALGEEAEAASA
jgi:hypothetical protein